MRLLRELIMVRRYKEEPVVQGLISDLCRLYSGCKSVAKLSQACIEVVPEIKVSFHPNRVNSLLNGEAKQSINEKTVEAFLQAISKIDIVDIEDVAFQEEQKNAFLGAMMKHEGKIEQALVEMSSTGHPLELYKQFSMPSADTNNDSHQISKIKSDRWGWQSYAISQTLSAIENNPTKKIGLIVPTGGGKTRIAVLVLRKLLISKPDQHVLWFAHRDFLLDQAKKVLWECLQDLDRHQRNDIWQRVHFQMMSSHESFADARKYHPEAEIFVVDEAHRAGAAIYQPLLANPELTGLLLTATPNRTDGQPIGIDKIGYQTSYKHLIKAGCILEPQFEEYKSTSSIGVFDTEISLIEFADYLLDNSMNKFEKSLVCVSRKEDAKRLYEMLHKRLGHYSGHSLTLENLGYIHGTHHHPVPEDTKNTKDNFFEYFKKMKQSLLIATSSLVSEGYDDPGIDSVYVTYKSTSVLQLMQLAGRALRYDPDKHSATIIQVRSVALQYFFSSQWLYQDISDQLRPKIYREPYSNGKGISQAFNKWMEQSQVNIVNASELKKEIAEFTSSEEIRIFFIGLPFYGSPENFESQSEWFGGVFLDDSDALFVERYNRLSCETEITDHSAYVENKLQVPRGDANYRWWCDLVLATNYAKKEIAGSWDVYRGQTSDSSCSWLLNTSFYPVYSEEPYNNFLIDCTNAQKIRQKINLAGLGTNLVKMAHPISAYEAFILADTQLEWLTNYASVLREAIASASPDRGWQEVRDMRETISYCPVPQRILLLAEQLLDPDAYNYQVWRSSSNSET